MGEGHKVRTYVLLYVRFWNCCVQCGVKLRHKASDMYVEVDILSFAVWTFTTECSHVCAAEGR